MSLRDKLRRPRRLRHRDAQMISGIISGLPRTSYLRGRLERYYPGNDWRGLCNEPERED